MRLLIPSFLQLFVFLFSALLCALRVSAVSVVAASDFEEKRLDNWHQWRGPDATGTAPRGDPPLEWSETENVRWKRAIPGEGSASPIVWGDRIFLLTAIETDRAEKPTVTFPGQRTTPPGKVYRYAVVCVDRPSGSMRWQRVAAESVPHEGRHGTNTYASGSPVTDGRRVIASFGSRGIFAYDMEGKLLWKRDLGLLRTRLGWGEGTSPSLHGDTVVVNRDQEDQSSIVALDASSGKTRWKMDRDEPSSWSTPLVTEHGGRTQVIVNATNRVRSYDLATGDVIWQCGGQTLNTIPSPVTQNGVVYCMSSYRGAAAYAIPLDAKGDITDTGTILWRHERGTPYCPSPLLYKGRLYFTSGLSNPMTCLDAATGKPVFGTVRLPELDRIYASPVAAADRIYFTGRNGTTVVIKHADTFEVLAVNHLDEPIDASPAIVGRQMLLRGRRHLYCLEEAAESR